MKTMLLAVLGAAVLAHAAKNEEAIVEMLENGRFTEAQTLAGKSGLKGAEVDRIGGFLFHGAGIADSALVYLKRASLATPKDPRVQLRLAEVLVWKKDFLHAREALESVSPKDIARDPRPWESASRRANVLVYLQDLKQARTAFLVVVDDPKTPSTWAMAARVYLAQIAAWGKDFAQCLAMTDSVLQKDPGHIQASLIKGQVLEWQGKYAQARTTYTQALQKHPDEWQLRQRLEKLSWVK